MTDTTLSDWNPIYGSMAEREKHYARQTARVDRWEEWYQRQPFPQNCNRPLLEEHLRHSTDAEGLWN